MLIYQILFIPLFTFFQLTNAIIWSHSSRELAHYFNQFPDDDILKKSFGKFDEHAHERFHRTIYTRIQSSLNHIKDEWVNDNGRRHLIDEITTDIEGEGLDALKTILAIRIKLFFNRPSSDHWEMIKTLENKFIDALDRLVTYLENQKLHPVPVMTRKIKIE